MKTQYVIVPTSNSIFVALEEDAKKVKLLIDKNHQSILVANNNDELQIFDFIISKDNILIFLST